MEIKYVALASLLVFGLAACNSAQDSADNAQQSANDAQNSAAQANQAADSTSNPES